MPAKRKSVSDVVKEQMGGMPTGHKPDGAFNPDDQEFGIFGQPRSQGEIIRDRLISSCRPKDGWYIQLEKDAGTNEFVYLEKITSYDHWTNLKAEITEYVREKTKKEISKIGKVISYGSGRYCIKFLNTSGNRDEDSTIIISVDAQEHLIDAPTSINPLATDAVEILKTMQAGALQPQSVTEAMMKGIEIGAKRDEAAASGNNQMMTAMFTMMGTVLSAVLGKPAPVPAGPDPMVMMNSFMSMAKNFGAFEKNVPQKTLIEMVQELKLMGISIGGSNDDMTTSVGKLKGVLDVLRSLGVVGGNNGEGERAPLWERVVERHGDKIFDVIGGVIQATTAAKSEAPAGPAARVMTRRNPPQRLTPASPAPAPIEAPQEHEQGGMSDDPFADTASQEQPPPMMETDMQVQDEAQDQIPSPEEADMLEKFKMITRFAKELREAVINDRTDLYPYITKTISDFTDAEEADFKVKVGEITAETIIGYVLKFDGKNYADPAMKQKLVSYVNRYIEHIKAQGPYYAKCNKCQDYAPFENKSQFISEQDKTCGQELQNGVCDGVLQETY